MQIRVLAMPRAGPEEAGGEEVVRQVGVREEVQSFVREHHHPKFVEALLETKRRALQDTQGENDGAPWVQPIRGYFQATNHTKRRYYMVSCAPFPGYIVEFKPNNLGDVPPASSAA